MSSVESVRVPIVGKWSKLGNILSATDLNVRPKPACAEQETEGGVSGLTVGLTATSQERGLRLLRWSLGSVCGPLPPPPSPTSRARNP